MAIEKTETTIVIGMPPRMYGAQMPRKSKSILPAA